MTKEINSSGMVVIGEEINDQWGFQAGIRTPNGGWQAVDASRLTQEQAVKDAEKWLLWLARQ